MKKFIVIFSVVAVSIAMVECSPKANKATTATSTTAATETKPVAATATAEQIEAGHVVYTNNCGKCHGLKEPGNYTKDAWTPILKGMIPKAKLNADDAKLVTAYVMANAKQG